MRLASATGPSVPRALLSGDANADMLGWFATCRSVDAIGQRGPELCERAPNNLRSANMKIVRTERVELRARDIQPYSL